MTGLPKALCVFCLGEGTIDQVVEIFLGQSELARHGGDETIVDFFFALTDLRPDRSFESVHHQVKETILPLAGLKALFREGRFDFTGVTRHGRLPVILEEPGRAGVV